MNKKRLLLLLAIPFISCQNEPEVSPTPDGGVEESGKITLYASAGQKSNVNTRVNYEEESLAGGGHKLVLTWGQSDKFMLYDKAGEKLSQFNYAGEGKHNSGAFIQANDKELGLVDGETYTAIVNWDKDITAQSGSLDQIADERNYYLNRSVKLQADFEYNASGDQVIVFSLLHALIKLNMILPDGEAAKTIKLTDGEGGEVYSLTVGDEGESYDDSTLSIYMGVNPTEAVTRTMTIDVTTVKGNDYTFSKEISAALEAGKNYALIADMRGDLGYVDYYASGYVAPNGVTYSSENGVLVSEDTTISKAGVYFIEDGVTCTVNATSNAFVLIGRNSNSKPVVEVGGAWSLTAKTSTILKNITLKHLDTNNNGYIFKANGDGGLVENWIVEDCDFISGNNKGFSYCSQAGFAIRNIVMRNNKFKFNTTTAGSGARIISFGKQLSDKNAVNFENVEFTNNVVYTNSAECYSGGQVLFMDNTCAANNTENLVVNVSNNLFVNFASTNGTLVLSKAKSMTFKDNIFAVNENVSIAKGTTVSLLKYIYVDAPAPTPNDVEQNVYYGFIDSNYWNLYSSASTFGFDKTTTKRTKEATDPIDSYNYETGEFVVNSAYSTYGPQSSAK